MEYPVIVQSRSPGQYVARPLGIPELTREATTEAEALRQVSEALGEWFVSAKVVQVTAPTADTSNPWLDAFGRSASDPDFDEFLEEIKHVPRLTLDDWSEPV